MGIKAIANGIIFLMAIPPAPQSPIKQGKVRANERNSGSRSFGVAEVIDSN